MSATICYLGDPARHFWLTRSLARTMQLNLSEAMARGHLTARDYADLVTRCRMCPHVETCEAWLAANGAGADAAPEHCANRDALNELSALTV